MSRIAELIEELCPFGVPYKELSMVARRNKGINITAGKMKQIVVPNGNIRIFAAGQNFVDTDENFVDKLKVIHEPSVIVKSRGHIGFEYYEKPFQHKNEMWSYQLVSDELNLKFIYYFLSSKVEYFQNLAKATSVKLPQLSVKDTDNYKIPVPPLKIQEEIVRILDRFTLLEAELEAELEARRKQHAHFRDSLLGRKEMESSQVVELKEVCDFEYGLTETAKSEGSVRFIRITDIDENGHLKKDSLAYVEDSPESRKKRLSSGDVVVARTGASFGKSLYFDKPIDASYASFLIKITCRNGVLDGKYLWHFMQSRYYWKQAEILVSRGGQPQFNSNAISRVKIPVPDMKRQKEIVILLDKFDALANDISSGLPAEIAARRKQYEHYRDKLLTFKELQPEAA